MIALSAQNAAEYLRQSAHASATGEILIQNIAESPAAPPLLKIFDTAAGDRVGTDLRSPAQKKLGKPDPRPFQGRSFLLKQSPSALERHCVDLLSSLLPAGTLPEILWADEQSNILAFAAPPLDALLWHKALAQGQIYMDASTHAGMILAMLHSSTSNDPAIAERFADPRAFTDQCIQPHFASASTKNPSLAPSLQQLAKILLSSRLCLIHAAFTPHNIFLIPHPEPPANLSKPETQNSPSAKFPISHLTLLNFHAAFYGHPVYDVASLTAQLLLHGFEHHKKWRPYMLLADNFWQTYRHTADPDLVRSIDTLAGPILGALLLTSIDGPAPAAELAADSALQDQIRRAATELLTASDPSLDHALDTASMHFDDPQ